ncbi:MAG: hypothetical protein WBH28_14095 [Fuerstiella sp.]
MASSRTKAAASPETVADFSPASILTFATPGSDCNVEVTVARHPPHVIPGHTNLARATALASTDAGAEAAGADPGCSAHPAAATNIRHNSCLRIVIDLTKTN